MQLCLKMILLCLVRGCLFYVIRSALYSVTRATDSIVLPGTCGVIARVLSPARAVQPIEVLGHRSPLSLLPLALSYLLCVQVIVFDDRVEDAPPEILQDVMLSIVLPLATHVWIREGEEEAWGLQRQHQQRNQRQRQGHNNRGLLEPARGGPSAAVATTCDGHNPANSNALKCSRTGLRGRTGSNGGSRPPTPGRDESTAGGYGREFSRSNRDGHVDGDGGGGGHLVQEETLSRTSSRSVATLLPAVALPSPTSSPQEDGFEMVEAPPPAVAEAVKRRPGKSSSNNHSGVRRVEWESSMAYAGDGSGGAGGGGGGGRRGVAAVGAGGTVALSSPGLLALLLLSKSFLKHLSSLRRATNFGGLWRQVSEEGRESE